jgi:glucokinase
MSGLLLAGDIGGTKANLVLVDPAGDPRRPLFTQRLASNDFPSLEALLETFLSAAGQRARHVCVGIPAPVIDGHVAPVNIRWQAQEESVARHVGAEKVRFLNDLVATALGIPELLDSEVVTLHAGAPRSRGPKAVVAPGTGLGTGFLLHDGTRYQAYGAEGGHADFAPRGATQTRLHAFLANDGSVFDGQINVEAVCSGKGINNLWRFFGHQGLRDSAAIETQAVGLADATPLIMQAAEQPELNPRSAAAAQEFITILLQEAGNAAVRWVASGGVYLAGGVPPKVLTYLRRPAMMATYLSNRHLGQVLRETPLYVVMNDSAAVLGAIAGGRTLF